MEGSLPDEAEEEDESERTRGAPEGEGMSNSKCEEDDMVWARLS